MAMLNNQMVYVFFHDGFMVLSGFIKLPGSMIIPSNPGMRFFTV